MSKVYTIEELVEITGIPRRTIRYYIQIGLISPPAGRGRGGFYNDSHVSDLLRIKELQQSGASLSTISESLKTLEGATYKREVWSRQEIIDGVEIHIRRDVEEKEHKKTDELIKIARSIFKGD
ncbi:MAG: MerR family transcriptional regulator [Thermodesulfovibrionales bacterium]|nr:MerR family transcriptional regulator [Thermodesulfovibrionales bacterium]